MVIRHQCHTVSYLNGSVFKVSNEHIIFVEKVSFHGGTSSVAHPKLSITRNK